MEHKYDLKKVRHQIQLTKIRIKKEFFTDFLEHLKAKRRELEELFDEYGGHGEIPDQLYDKAAEVDSFLAEAAEILIVGINHWAEREIKQLYVRLKGSSGRLPESIPRLVGAFQNEFDVDLQGMPQFESLHAMSLICNDWKHNPWKRPSANTLEILGAAPVDEREFTSPALLLSSKVSEGFRQVLRLKSQDGSQLDIVEELVGQVHGFLLELMERTASISSDEHNVD